MKAKKCLCSCTDSLHRGTERNAFLGLSMGGFSWFKRILYDRVPFLIFGIVITHVIGDWLDSGPEARQ